MVGERTTVGDLVGGRFMLERELGRGGAATVWRAKDLEADGRVVAVKLIHRNLRLRPRVRERFDREARLLRSLNAPSICRLIAAELDARVPFIAMELAPGCPLDEEIGRRAASQRPFTIAAIRRMMEQLCAAVSAAHDAGVVHRDLKPANIMYNVDSEGQPSLVVLDFGIAKVISSASDETTRGRQIGSTAHMSPEQARGDSVDRRSDVFGLGVVLYEIATLRRPWLVDASGMPALAYAGPVPKVEANMPVALRTRMLAEPPAPPSTFHPALGADFDRAVARALAPAPGDRTADAATLLRQLGPATEQTGHAERGQAAKLRNSALLALAVALLVTAAIVVLRARPSESVAPRTEGDRPAWSSSSVKAVAAPPKPKGPAHTTRTTTRAESSVVKARARIRRPKRTPAAKPPPRRSSKNIAAIRSSLADAERSPGDLALLTSVGERIHRTAEHVPDERVRTRIRGLVRSSTMLGDLDGLKKALRELEANLP